MAEETEKKDGKNKRKPRGIYKRAGKDGGSAFWWIRYAGLDGRIVRESCGSDKYKKAEALLIQRKAEIQEGRQEKTKRIQNCTFRELSVEYMAWSSARQKSAVVKKYIVKDLVERFGNLPLSRFTQVVAEQLQTAYIDNGHKPSYVNKVVSVFKHMFAKARDWKYVSEDTVKEMRVPMLKEDARLRYLLVDECQTLVEACDPHLRPIVVTALNSGMRKGEILSLQWRQVDLRNGFVLLEKTKNGERREIPINDSLRNVFNGLVRRLDIPHVFHDPASGKPYGDVKKSFRSALGRVETLSCPDCRHQHARVKSREKTGKCPDCGSKLVARAGIDDFHFHDLRHTFASHLVMSGVDLTTVSRLLGHKNLKMTLRYAHLAPSHLAKAVDILDRTLRISTDTKTDTVTKKEVAVKPATS